MRRLRRIPKALPLFALLAGGACGPMPGWGPPHHARHEDDRPRGGVESSQDLWFIDTGFRDTYYVVDGKRGLCYFRHEDAMTPIDCDKVSDESGEGAGSGAPGGEAGGEEEGAAEPETDGAGKSVDPGPAPTEEELVRFARAYGTILCAGRSGQEVDPDQVLSKEGLTPERYAQIEGVVRRDEKAWRSLVTKASRSCGASD